MKNISKVFLISIFSLFLFGCTVLPASEETGVGPQEYTSIKEAEEIKKENDSLNEEVNTLNDKVKSMEEDYLKASKNNESLMSKLEEAELKLQILENEGIPKFNLEENDKNSIVAYLNNNKSTLEKGYKNIELIETNNENKVLFYTTGYGDSYNQIFAWTAGEKEPVLVDKATFTKDGDIVRINDSYLLIYTGENNEYKVLDTIKNSIISEFNSKQDVYLIPNTLMFIVQNNETNKFAVYDFLNSKENEIELNYNNKYTSYKADENKIIFNGTYTDENETEYEIKATIPMNKIKEVYATEQKTNESDEANNESQTIESEDAV